MCRPCAGYIPSSSWIDAVVAVFVVLALAATLTLLGLLQKKLTDDLATKHFSVRCTGDQVVMPGPGDGDALFYGDLTINVNMKIATWKFLHKDLDGAVTSIKVHGPLTATSLEVAPEKLVLCGFPSASTCNQNVANEITGTLDVITPGNTSPEAVLKEIFKDRPFFYMQVYTDAFPNGAVRCPLDKIT